MASTKDITKHHLYKHGHSPSKKTSTIYNSWRAAKERCFNPNSYGYRFYGARGITMCERWRHSFVNFLADMGAQPPGYTLERKDSNGNYEPDNCIWAPWSDQHNNRRDCIYITHDGKTLTLKQWSRVMVSSMEH